MYRPRLRIRPVCLRLSLARDPGLSCHREPFNYKDIFKPSLELSKFKLIYTEQIPSYFSTTLYLLSRRSIVNCKSCRVIFCFSYDVIF